MTHCFQYIMKRASATNPHWHVQPLTVVYGESAPSRLLIQKIAMVWHGLWINRTCWHCKLTVSNFALDLFTADSNIQSELSHKFTARPIDSVYSPPPLSALIVLFENYVKVTAHWLLCVWLLTQSQMRYINTNSSFEQINMTAYAFDYKQQISGINQRR